MENSNSKSARKREWLPYFIILSFVLFGGLVVAAVIHMVNQDVDLVAPNYYQQEVAFQSQIDKEINTRTLKKYVDLKYSKVEGQIQLAFPLDSVNHLAVSGTIKLYCPSDAKLDQEFEVKPDTSSGLQVLEVGPLKAGPWTIQMDWKEGGLGFFEKKEILVQP